MDGREQEFTIDNNDNTIALMAYIHEDWKVPINLQVLCIDGQEVKLHKNKSMKSQGVKQGTKIMLAQKISGGAKRGRPADLIEEVRNTKSCFNEKIKKI
jgi:hypothetical protein